MGAVLIHWFFVFVFVFVLFNEKLVQIQIILLH